MKEGRENTIVREEQGELELEDTGTQWGSEGYGGEELSAGRKGRETTEPGMDLPRHV